MKVSGRSYPVRRRSQTSQSLRTSEEEEGGGRGCGGRGKEVEKVEQNFHATSRLVLRKNIVIIYVSDRRTNELCVEEEEEEREKEEEEEKDLLFHLTV